jgi:nucleotidyltransferase/DNA polymerase involved in DNA repair
VIGCVLVPYFAVAVERRDDPSLAGVPLIIVGLARDSSRVFAVSDEAAQVGVEPEMTLRQAQILCPQAHLIPADQPRYQRAFDEFLEVLAYFTPDVEPDGQGPGAIGYLDLGRLKGAEVIEMAKRIGQTVRGEVSLAPALGVADGKFPAYVAAASTQPNRVLIVAPGQEVAFLAPFPVDLLPLDGEVLRRLRLLGIRTLGQLAALPSSAVITQLGTHGQTLHRLAQGRDDRPILPHHPEEVERASRQFEDFITSRTTLEAIAKAMAIDLADRLQARGLVARQLRLVLHLEDEAIHQEQLVMRHPSSAPGRLASILGELVAEIQLQQGVSEIEIVLANLIPARGQQLDLFIHQTRQRQRLDDVLKDLLARYGAGCFYQASLFDRAAPLLERRFQMQEMETP